MKRTLNSVMPCSRSSSSLASVTSSLHCEDDLAGVLVDDVVRGDLADELRRRRSAGASMLRVLQLLDGRAW